MWAGRRAASAAGRPLLQAARAELRDWSVRRGSPPAPRLRLPQEPGAPSRGGALLQGPGLQATRPRLVNLQRPPWRRLRPSSSDFAGAWTNPAAAPGGLRERRAPCGTDGLTGPVLSGPEWGVRPRRPALRAPLTSSQASAKRSRLNSKPSGTLLHYMGVLRGALPLSLQNSLCLDLHFL